MTEPASSSDLVGTIQDDPGHWFVEACAGSGKSHLARHLAQHPGTALVRWSAADDSAPALPDEPLLVVDIAPHPGSSASLRAWIEQATDGAAPSDRRIVVLARSFDGATHALLQDLDATGLTERELWFDPTDTRECLSAAAVGIDPTLTQAVHEITDGWPLAVTQASETLGLDRGIDARSARLAAEGAMANCLEPPISELTAELRRTVDALAFVDRFDAEFCARLGQPDAIALLRNAGVPISAYGDRWLRLTPAIRSHVLASVGAPPSVSEKSLEYLADAGDPQSSIESAIDLDQPAVAARLLARLGPDQTYALDEQRLNAVCAVAEADLRHEPRSFLVRGRFALSTGQLTQAVELFTEGHSEVSPGHDDASLQDELEAELGFAHYLSGNLDLAKQTLPKVRPGMARVAAARTLEIEAGLAALSMTRDGLAAAADLYRQATSAWREAGQLESANAATSALAMEVLSRSGRHAAAAALLAQTSRTTAGTPIMRASNRMFSALALSLAGRHEEATRALAETETAAALAGASWMVGYIEWSRALIASHNADADLTRAHATKAVAGFGDLMEHATGALLHADLVAAFCRCGAAEAARQELDALEAHHGSEPPDVLLANAIFHCRVGDAAAGLARAQELWVSDFVVPGGDWRLHFAEAVAHRRAGDEDAFRASLKLAKATGRTVDPDRIVDAVEGTALGQTTVPESVEAETATTCFLQLFDAFTVTVEGGSVAVPPGRAQLVLKLLVLSGGLVTIDEVIDALWPETPADVGRRRFRNILSRVRSACGDVVERDGEVIRLTPGASSSDYAAWRAEALELVEAASPALDDVEAVLDRAGFELLPGDRYEDWFEPFRTRHEATLLRLLDLKAALATEAGRVDAAVSAYDRALDIDLWAEERIEAAVALLNDADRPAQAAEFERHRREQQQLV